MIGIDDLLSIVENPTRRRILEYLTREPSYPLQLSKELGISQQAVMKNLALMEQNGMLVSYHEESRMGPSRTVYAPNTQFTLMIDMHDSMFTARLIAADDAYDRPDENDAGMDGFDEALAHIRGIDSEIDELDKKRAELLNERNAVMNWCKRTVRAVNDPLVRAEMYGRMDRLADTKEDMMNREV